MKTKLAQDLGLQYPIFAFTRTREVAAAVTRAGGMGVLGLIDKTLDGVRADLDWMDANTEGKPYGVDVVMPAKYVGSDQAQQFDSAAFEAMIPEIGAEPPSLRTLSSSVRSASLRTGASRSSQV